MLQTVNFKQDNVVGLRISSDLTGNRADSFISKITDKLEQYDKVRVYIEMDDIDSISWEAMKAELKVKTKMDIIQNIEKLAYVSDSMLVDLGSFFADLLPGIDAESFSMDEKESAKEWISS